MTLVITDVLPDELRFAKDCEVIFADGNSRYCAGCFGCWVKTPGRCVIRDDIGDMGAKLGKCDRLIVVSRCVYGGYSPQVKRVLDRSISYIHPDFTYRGGEMHHKRRYGNVIAFSVYLYGDTTEKERKTAAKLVNANVVNFDGRLDELRFYPDAAALSEAFV